VQDLLSVAAFVDIVTREKASLFENALGCRIGQLDATCDRAAFLRKSAREAGLEGCSYANVLDQDFTSGLETICGLVQTVDVPLEPSWKNVVDDRADDFFWNPEIVSLWGSIKAADRPGQIRLLEEATSRATLIKSCPLLEALRFEP
jgi:hypothetical protein